MWQNFIVAKRDMVLEEDILDVRSSIIVEAQGLDLGKHLHMQKQHLQQQIIHHTVTT